MKSGKGDSQIDPSKCEKADPTGSAFLFDDFCQQTMGLPEIPSSYGTKKQGGWPPLKM